jgi:hypothetical protein
LSAVTTIGLDIAKNVFQVHGVDCAGAVVVAKSIRRAQVLAFFASLPPCLVGIEACSSAHHWARALIAMGHQAKLIPPAYVKPYVLRRHPRRNRNRQPPRPTLCHAPSSAKRHLSFWAEGAYARERQSLLATGRVCGLMTRVMRWKPERRRRINSSAAPTRSPRGNLDDAALRGPAPRRHRSCQGDAVRRIAIDASSDEAFLGMWGQ